MECEPENILPPMLVNNPRERIEAQQISLTEILPKSPRKRKSIHKIIEAVPEPKPRFPLELSRFPHQMCFKLDQETVTQKLRLWNICKHTIYVLNCGMWDDTARLGASWFCSPHTRILVPPGFIAKITITATPRGCAPIPCATSAVQVALANKRDLVVGYIVVPVCVKFLSYRPPSFGEGG